MVTIDPLVLSFCIDIVKVAEHFDRGDVCSRIVDNSFAAVLDDVLKKLECLIYLAPLAGFFLQEATVNAWHNFVEILTGRESSAMRQSDKKLAQTN